MEYSNKTSRDKLFKSKSSNLKAIFHKSPSYNKSTNKTKYKTDVINFNNSNYKQKLIYNNLKKYCISAKTYNQYIINDIIFDHRNHIVAVFKNYLLWDETSEFLKRYYPKKDVTGRLPKISEYYEQYTLFTPNYLSNEGLIVVIMIKWIKRKKKYLQYLEEKEEASKNNKHRKNLNQNFEPLFNEEIITLTKTKSKSFFSSCLDLSKNTLELTTFDKEQNNHKRKNSENKVYSDKNNKDFKIDEDFKNSISFTEIFDDLSSHFSILINNNNSKEYQNKQKPIKNFNNKKAIMKKEINIKNNPTKLSKKLINQKSQSKKLSINKQQQQQQNIITKKEKEKEKEKEILQVKVKEVHKVNKIQKKPNSKKTVFSKDKSKKEKEKINENNKENNKPASNTKEIKRYQKVAIININPKENKENRDINTNIHYNNNQTNKAKMKNISILNSNSGKNKKMIIENDENLNTINTISNINPQYYSLGKLMKNNKQSSAIKKINMKSLNLLNFNPNVIPNLKKIVSKQKDKKIIFPRNFNLMYNNNTNKLNSIKKENYDQMKLLTDRDKENTNKMIMDTNENCKFIKLNDNTSIYNNNNINNIDNIYFDQSDVFAKKVSKLIKKKHISLIGDNLSFKEPSNSNILLYKNEMNEKNNINNVSNLNNLRYKKNSVLRQFNSKRDFNFSNSKNNLLQNYNNISNNSISSSSSSLNSLNKKKLRLSNYLSQNNSINKRKSLQKINLNLNLQINFNINLDKKNKKLILGKRLNNRIFNEITNNKNIAQQNIQNNDSNNNSNNISVPLTQRCYYNINQYKKCLCEQRSASSSNSKKKKRVKN